MSYIDVKNLSFCYDGSYDPVFEDVSFRIDTDWRCGLIGRNGRGKTTLLRLLCGAYDYSGRIHASVEFDYFPYHVADPAALTDAVLEELCPAAAPWQRSRELSLLKVSDDVLYRPFETLSNGEQTKVLLAGLFLNEQRFLLIDEPTNHLDMEARTLVSGYLRQKSGFLLVSHDRAFLDRCVDHIFALNRNGMEIQQGNFSSWFLNKQRQDAGELARNAQLKADIRRLSEAAARTKNWSDQVEKTKKGGRIAGLRPDRGAIGHKAAKMMKRAKAAEARKIQAAEEKAGLLKNIETAEPLSVHPLPYPKQRLAELDGVAAAYAGTPAGTGVRFALEKGDRIALTGRNGCGKSSILKLLAGEAVPHTGRLLTGSGLVVSYVPQNTGGLSGSLRAFIQARGIDESLCKAILRKLDFSRTQFEKDMAAYSAGQKKKVYLAASLCERAHLYLWDEPLNYIDVFSRMQIEELLLTCQPTMLFVEHDRCFVDRLATQVIDLDRG